MTEEKIKKIQKSFKSIDERRLLYGAGDAEALFLHGMMLGIRETLESRRIEIEGVTGLWWYEKLGNEKRQDSIEILKERYGTSGNMEYILKGNQEGINWILETIGDLE